VVLPKLTNVNTATRQYQNYSESAIYYWAHHQGLDPKPQQSQTNRSMCWPWMSVMHRYYFFTMLYLHDPLLRPLLSSRVHHNSTLSL